MIAALVEFALAAALAVILVPTTGQWFAARSVVMLHVGEPGTLWTGPIPMVLSAAGPFVYGFPFALLLIRAARPRRFLDRAAPEILFVAGLVTGRWEAAAAAVIVATMGAIGAMSRVILAIVDRRFAADVPAPHRSATTTDRKT